MACCDLSVSVRTSGIIELNGALASVVDVLKRLDITKAPEIEGHGLGIAYQGAPLVDVQQTVEGEAGQIVIVTELRPAAGLGILVAELRALSCGDLIVKWENGWPSVSLPPPPPTEDTAAMRPMRETVET